MSRRLQISLALALALAALTFAEAALAASDPASIPTGPRLVFLEGEYVTGKGGGQSEPAGRARIISTDPQGHDALTLTTPRSASSGGLSFSWSADGSEYAFVGKPAQVVKEELDSEGDDENSSRAIVARSGNPGERVIARTKGTTAAVLSPDGRWLAFTRTRLHQPKVNWKNPKSVIEALEHGYESRSAWVVPTAGGRPRRVTPWGKHKFAEPTSFSPDGSTLLVTDEGTGSTTEVDGIDLATGKRRVIQLEASEASFSPDGSQIAFISYRDHESVSGFDENEASSEVYMAAADGSGAHRVTQTPKFEETAPTWDPSGERLAYLRSPGGLFGILLGRVAESNPDGSCTKVLPRVRARRKDGHILIGEPTWWPGPERGAGRLSC